MIPKIKIFFILLFFLTSCLQLPGINDSPKKQTTKKKAQGEYSINDVEINIINLNKASDSLIDFYNKRKIQTLDYKIKEFNDIYNYKYEYVLGTSDVITINLTDTDDIDNSYILDTEGMIDLPFIGKVKISDLTLDQAETNLSKVIEKYYKNPDLQVKISEYNSSKVFMLGAVRNQITINLDQEPIKIIEAAIQANFNPSS